MPARPQGMAMREPVLQLSGFALPATWSSVAQGKLWMGSGGYLSMTEDPEIPRVINWSGENLKSKS